MGKRKPCHKSYDDLWEWHKGTFNHTALTIIECNIGCASENPCEGPAVSRGTFMRHVDLGDGAP